MKVLWNKFKRTNLSTRLVYITSFLIFLVSYIIFIINALRLEGIETTIRIIVLVVLGFILLLYGFIDLLLLLRKKRFTVYFSSLFVILISAGCIIGSMTINRILGSMDSLSKDTVIYTTNLIALNSTEFVNDGTFITGIIDNDTDVEGYILPYELINKEKLNLKIEKYSNYFEMLEDLYSGKINGMFVSSNYTITYSVYDGYANIKEETKVLKEYSKEMKNQDYIENFASVTDPFTILVMGVDSTADTLKKASSFNGDTLMMISFNPHTLNATVFSIPRDTYVPIACLNGDSSKINSSGAYGTKCVINTVQSLTGINIDYYVKVDFQGVVDLVNAVGGIDVDVEVPSVKSFLAKHNNQLCESDSHRNMVNLVCMDTGYQHLNGEQALAYARNRHGYLDGDFARNRHQQVVVEGIAKNIKNISSVNDFYTILDTIAPNIDTNMQTKEMLSLYGVAKTALQSNNGALINVEKTRLTGYDLTMYVNNLRSNVYTFQYYPQSLQEIVDAMNVTLGKKKANMITEFSFSANKEYKVPIIGERYYSVERNETVPNFAGQTQSQVKAWCDQRSITMYVNYVHEGDELYDSTLTEGTVVGQNVIKGKLVKDINSITINVVTHWNPDATTSIATTESTTTESTTTGATTPAEETIEE
jgi:LCP family protein required for cell wall assembly